MNPRRSELIRVKKILKPIIRIMYLPIREDDYSLEEIKSLEFELFIVERKNGEFLKVSIDLAFLKVREELLLNLSMPIESEKKQYYLDEVMNLYVEIEDNILEDNDGNLSTELDRFLKSTNQNELFFDDYEKLLTQLKNKLIVEISFIAALIPKHFEKKAVNNFQILESDRDLKKSKGKSYSNKSFNINPSLFASDPNNAEKIIAEKLKEFKDALLDGEYIKPIDFRDFLRIFNNQDVKNPIQWVANPQELYFLMKTLYDLELIVRFKNFWQITCKCFLAYRKNNTVCTPEYLQRCKAPTLREQRRKLNSVIDTLK